MRFRKCENWGWFKGLIILSEQPIMIQQIAVCQKFYLKPKINKNYQLTLYHNWIAKKCQNWKFEKPRFSILEIIRSWSKVHFRNQESLKKRFLLYLFFTVFLHKNLVCIDIFARECYFLRTKWLMEKAIYLV